MKTYRIIGIKKLLPILTLLLPLQSLAQSIYIYPAAPIAPRGSYQTVTAIVTGVNDKTVTWTASGGTLVGTNPCVVNEPCTVAVYDTTAETDTLTATTNVGSVTATSTITFTASPTPVKTHPRLLVTAAMLPGLQAKATTGNVIYQSMRTRAINLYTTDSAIWTFSTWNGSACVGGSGPSFDQSQSYKEGDANLFAFMSMIDPSDPTYQWGCAGRDIFTYLMGTYIANPGAYGGNRWSGSAQAFSLTVDWLMAGGYLSSADQTQARTFLAATAQYSITMSYGTSAPIGNYNSSSQFDTGSEWDYASQRAMGNNYTQSKMLYLTAAALTFNDNTTDDPPLANTCSATRYQVCPDGTAGSLHAYWTYFTGGMLYKDWADMEDPNVTWQAYQVAYGNLPTEPSCDSTWAPLGTTTPCFGLGRGGEANEGSSYGGSLTSLKTALDAAYTAGYLDPILYGPQMSLASSSYFDLRYISDLATLTGPVPDNSITENAGASPGGYNFLNTGDELSYTKYPSNYTSQTAMLLANSYTGRTEGNSAMLWTILNTAFGGPLGTSYRCKWYCGFTGELTNDFAADVALDLFITQPAGDPTSSLPADPRPALPTDLYDAGNQHIMVRNNWAAGGTLFSYYAPNTAIDHEHQFDGRFDVFANGEYITKGRVEFNDYNNLMTTAPQQSLVAYQNNPSGGCTDAGGCFEGDAAQNGGQWWHAEQGGLVTLLHSELPTYVAAIVDQSNAYNTSAYADFPSYASGITASRSLIYLRGSNQVVYYDRGSSGSNAWTKQLYQMTTGNPTISGNVANWLTRSETQKAYFTSLLPSGAALTNAGLTPGTGTNQAPDWEPYTSLEVNAGSPTSTQFLSVLEWGSSSLTQSATTLVQSSGGQNFDCAEVGTSLVCFMRAWPATFTGVTYPASGATMQYVSDLTPNTTYTISGAGAPASGTTDTAGVLTFAAAGTGNVTVGGSNAPIVVNIAVTPATVVLQALASQQYAATCTYSDGSSADCTSESTWSSSARGVVTIDSSGMATGVAQGSANIIATSGSIQGQAAVTVPVATLQTIAVTPGPLTVPVGGTQQFKATGIYSNSNTTDMTSLVSWSSSNTAVALHNSTGLASMMSQGSAIIIAASGDVRGQATVTVSAAAAQVALVSHVASGSGVTSAVSMTGANMIAVCENVQSGAPTVPTDSSSNTYALSAQQLESGYPSTYLYTTFGPTVTGSMTFTAWNNPIAVLGFSGAASGPDQTTGANIGSPSGSTGSITPSKANELILSCVGGQNGGTAITATSSPLTLADSVNWTAYPGYASIASAYQIQTTATAVANTWTNNICCGAASLIASFYSAESPATLVATSTNLPEGFVSVAYTSTGSLYSNQLTATGGVAPYTWSVSSGTLPTGLSLSSGGLLTGTPTGAVSARSITYKVTDAHSTTATVTLPITIAPTAITVGPGTCTGSALNGTQYTAFGGCTLAGSGGTSPFSFNYSTAQYSYALPEGLSLNASTGAISGTVYGAGDYPVTFTESDSLGSYATQTITFPIAGNYTQSGWTLFPSDSIFHLNVASLPVDTSVAAPLLSGYQSHAIAVLTDVNSGGIPWAHWPSTQANKTVTTIWPGYNVAANFPPYTLLAPEYATSILNPVQSAPISPYATIEATQNNSNATGYIGDGHSLSVILPGGGNPAYLFEQYQAQYSGGQWYNESDGWWALNGYQMPLQDMGEATDEAGMPIAPFLLTYDEAVAGTINHAARFTLNSTLNYHVWPATGQAGLGACTGGYEDDNHLILQPGSPGGSPPVSGCSGGPEGEIYRLKASFSTSGICVGNTIAQNIITGFRNYGIILADNGGTGYITAAADSRWPDLSCLNSIILGDFEPVNVQSVIKTLDSSNLPTVSYQTTVGAAPTQAATPAFSPAAGTYTSAQTVTIGTTTPSATIYYTTNGSTPTTGSAVYSGPITVPSTETLQAIAEASGYSTSATGSAAYTINLPAVTPSFSVDLLPASLSVTAGQSGTTTVLITPTNGFASAVSFSCSGLPSGSSCSFSPATVIPSGGATSTTLTVSIVPTTAALHRNPSPLFPGSVLAIAFCCFGWKKRRGLHLLLLAGVAVGLSLCTGCGSEALPISAATSTVSVIATSGSMQPTTSFTLTVQ